MVTILYKKVRTIVTTNMDRYARVSLNIHLGKDYIKLVGKPCEVDCIVKIFESREEMENPHLNKTFCEMYEIDAGRFIQEEYGLEIGDILEKYGHHKILDLVLRKLFDKKYTAQHDGKIVDNDGNIRGMWNVFESRIISTIVENSKTTTIVVRL